MECQTAQEEILRTLDEGGPAFMNPAVHAHVSECAACTAFAARQKAIDVQLGAVLVPPELSPAFRLRLRKSIAREKARWWSDALPDVVHFTSLGVATLVCALLLPFKISLTLGTGTVIALLSYVVLTAFRCTFEDIDAHDRGFFHGVSSRRSA